MKNAYTNIILVAIIFLGLFFRTYKIDWGEGYFFHPDEYHVAAAINRIDPSNNLNPHLFSYGSTLVYMGYAVKELFHISNLFIAGRLVSQIFSTLLIVVMFFISKKFFSTKSALFISFLIAINPGLIQQAHFATPESLLIFFIFLTLFFLLQYSERFTAGYFILACCSLGFASGTKISAIILLPALFLIPLFLTTKKLKKPFEAVFHLVSGFISYLISHFLAFPYSILDWENFKRTTIYESGLGTGKQLIFYTQQFLDTKPFIFQFSKIYPYTLGLPILIMGTLGFFVMAYHAFRNEAPRSHDRDIFSSLLRRKRNPAEAENYSHSSTDVRPWFSAKEDKRKSSTLVIMTVFFAFVFFPSSVLFAKWTRFIAPTFPFFVLFSIYLITQFTSRKLRVLLSVVLIIPTFMWTLMFFSIYTHPDVRITADRWIAENISSDKKILTESRNMIEVPFGGNKKTFEFYDLESEPLLKNQLIEELEKSDYFIIQSRRLFANFQSPTVYPTITTFYTNLFNGALGFEEVIRFHSFPKLELGDWKLEIDDEKSEETFSVFDHPVIRVYKKTKVLTKKDYAKILKI